MKNDIVLKANNMIQKGRHDLNIIEQRTMLYVISMIEPNAEGYQMQYKFDIREFGKICGLEVNTGRFYEETKKMLKDLSDRSWWMEEADGSEVLVRWLQKIKTNKRSGAVTVTLDVDLVPFLYDLKKQFTKYELKNILAFKSRFSIILYEIMKSHEWKNSSVEYELDILKKRLNVHETKSYNDFGLFRTFVLDVAVAEVSEHTDILVTYETIKKGRKVVKVVFSIARKEQFLLAADEVAATTEIIDVDDQVTWDDYSLDESLSLDLFSEHLEFLSEACENNFSNEQMKVLHSLVTNGTIPFNLGNIQVEQFHFLRTCYLKMQAAGTETKIKNKFSYLQQVIKNEFIKPELNYGNHAESKKQYIQKKSRFNNFSAAPMDHDMLENISFDLIKQAGEKLD